MQIILRIKNKQNIFVILSAYFCIDESNDISFSSITYASILQLHEKHCSHLDGNKPVIGCIIIKLVTSPYISCFELNLSHCLHLRKVQTKEEKDKIKLRH